MLLLIEGKADANGMAVENTILHSVCPRCDRLWHNADNNLTLTMEAILNRLLLHEAVIVLETVKERVGALPLVKPTKPDSLWGATALPLADEGRPAHRVSLFAYPGKGGQYPQRRRANLLPPLACVS